MNEKCLICGGGVGIAPRTGFSYIFRGIKIPLVFDDCYLCDCCVGLLLKQVKAKK